MGDSPPPLGKSVARLYRLIRYECELFCLRVGALHEYGMMKS